MNALIIHIEYRYIPVTSLIIPTLINGIGWAVVFPQDLGLARNRLSASDGGVH